MSGQCSTSSTLANFDCTYIAADFSRLLIPVGGLTRRLFEWALLRQERVEPSEIDRRRLGKKVFADPQARETLNRLVHPAVLAETDRWRKRMRETGRDGAALIPLLFEANAGAGWDAVICIIG